MYFKSSLQFSTLVINYNTSRRLDGRKAGLKPLATSSAPNSIKHMHLWMLKNSLTPLLRVLLLYVLLNLSIYLMLIFFPQRPSSSNNIFDDLPALSAPLKTDLRDELDTYLSTDPEHVTDSIAWWYEKRYVYPRLHRMALDYLTIPGKFFSFSCSS